ncbi:MAG: pro-sigmaK processing inhibitor BofA family protein [Tissierellia bacterium]|nr:pro-sigmaK processing inhibitor BofA family protein [Tissierellia bacterium]
MMIIAALIGIFLMLVFTKLFSLSMKVIIKLLINSITGVVILFAFNLFAGFFSVNLDINFFNSLIAGFLGIPGLLLLMILNN